MPTAAPTFTGVPSWQDDHEAQECPICHKKFNFWFRRHHCRMCGRVVCGNCSPQAEKYLATSYVVTSPKQPFLESPHVPHRTCTECIEELGMIRRALSQISPRLGSSTQSPHTNHDSDNAAANSAAVAHARELMIQNVIPGHDDYLGRCPVCDKLLYKLPESMQEAHVDNCLKTYSMSPSQGPSAGPQRKRMLVSRLSQKECDTLGDCMICYEDFEPSQSVGRLECLCVFHEKCIFDWFARKGVGSCPLHNQSD